VALAVCTAGCASVQAALDTFVHCEVALADTAAGTFVGWGEVVLAGKAADTFVGEEVALAGKVAGTFVGQVVAPADTTADTFPLAGAGTVDPEVFPAGSVAEIALDMVTDLYQRIDLLHCDGGGGGSSS
jgi:hypothetical protein